MPIPLRFADPVPVPAPADALLLLPGTATIQPPGWLAVVRLPAIVHGHMAGCACCAPRSPWASTLIRLFQARARGETGFFTSVVASLPAVDAAALRTLLQSDPFLSASFAIATSGACAKN